MFIYINILYRFLKEADEAEDPEEVRVLLNKHHKFLDHHLLHIIRKHQLPKNIHKYPNKLQIPKLELRHNHKLYFYFFILFLFNRFFILLFFIFM
jgi:hypothetical protein